MKVKLSNIECDLEFITKGCYGYEGHCRFLDNSARYDTDGSPCMSTHAQWSNSLPCKVLVLNGDEDLNKNVEITVHEYLKQDSQG